MVRYVPTNIPAARSIELLDQFGRTGCDRAFAELVELHRAMVFGVCLKIIKNHADADDAAQAVFLTLAMEVRGGTKIAHLTGWLRQVARRVALDQYRSRSRRRKREFDATMPNDSLTNSTILAGAAGRGLPNELEQQELHEILQKALNELPAKYRSVMVLFYFGGLSLPEIAKQLNVKAKALGVRLLRARRMLATRLAKSQLASSLCVTGCFLHSHLHELLAQAIMQQQGGFVARSSLASAATGVTLTMNSRHAAGPAQVLTGTCVSDITPANANLALLDLVSQVIPVAKMFRRAIGPKNVAMMLACTSITGVGVASGVKMVTGQTPGMGGLDTSGLSWLLNYLNPTEWLNAVPRFHVPKPRMEIDLPRVSTVTDAQPQPGWQTNRLAEVVAFDPQAVPFTPMMLARLNAPTFADPRAVGVFPGHPLSARATSVNSGGASNTNPGSIGLPKFSLSSPVQHVSDPFADAGSIPLVLDLSSDSMALAMAGDRGFNREPELRQIWSGGELGEDDPFPSTLVRTSDFGHDRRSLLGSDTLLGPVSKSDSSSVPTPDHGEVGELPGFGPSVDLLNPSVGGGMTGEGLISGFLPPILDGDGSLVGAPIPEPGALLLVVGLAGALLRRQRAASRV